MALSYIQVNGHRVASRYLKNKARCNNTYMYSSRITIHYYVSLDVIFDEEAKNN